MAVEVESAFAELIGMAGGTAVMEDAGVPGEPAQMGRGSREEGVRVQKQAMKAIERRTKAELAAACRERGARDDAGKHAFMEACAWSGILFSACPTRQDCLPTALYQIRVAYLGRVHFGSEGGAPNGNMAPCLGGGLKALELQLHSN